MTTTAFLFAAARDGPRGCAATVGVTVNRAAVTSAAATIHEPAAHGLRIGTIGEALVFSAAIAAIGGWALAGGQGFGRILMLLVLAPLLEETVFRAGLQEALLQRLRRPDVANALTALAFALAHALAHGDARALAVVLPAWLVGRVYERGRRVRHCVALHALFNAAWIASMLGAASHGPF